MDSILMSIGEMFYPGRRDTKEARRTWAMDQNLYRKNLITWAAHWLDSKGVTLAPDRFKLLILDKLSDVKRSGTSEIKYLPRYLVQMHPGPFQAQQRPDLRRGQEHGRRRGQCPCSLHKSPRAASTRSASLPWPTSSPNSPKSPSKPLATRAKISYHCHGHFIQRFTEARELNEPAPHHKRRRTGHPDDAALPPYGTPGPARPG
jgi:hypothetical protein